MGYPWASYGGFLFKREEHIIWGTDIGWGRDPSYAQQRPLGSSTDVLTALAIGSATRTFELLLTPERFNNLEALLNSRATFTDWGRPIPDSRLAFLARLEPIEDVLSKNCSEPIVRKRRCRLTFISA